MLLVRDGIQFFDELHGFQIFMSTKLIGHPLTFFSGVIQIQHRRHGIHAKPVNVVPIEPTQGAIDEEVFDLSTSVVEYSAFPFRMPAFAGVGMVIEMRSIKKSQTMRVIGEMGRSPIHNDPNPRLMAGINKPLKILRRPKPTGGGEISRRLISPRSIKGVLHNRHQF